MSDHTFFRALMSIGGGSLVYNISRIVVIIVVARPLDVYDIGKYFIIVAITGVLFSIASFGTNITIVKSVAEEEDLDRKKKILFTSINFYLLSLTIIVALGWLINIAADYEELEPIHILFIISAALFQYLAYALQSIKKYKELSFSYVVSGVLYLSLAFLLVVILEYGIDGFFLSVALANLIPALFQYAVTIRETSLKYVLCLDRHILSSLLKFSFPLYLNQLYTNLYDRGYTLLLAYLLNPAAVAYYSIATRIPIAIEEVRKVYLSVFYPTIITTIKENTETALRYISTSVHLFYVLILLVSAVFLMVKVEVTTFVFGEKYAMISMAIFLLVARSAFTFCGPILGMSIIAFGHNKVPLYINFLVTTTTFTASYFLIPVYGYMAVVYIAVSGSMAGFLMNYMFLKIKYKNLNLRYILVMFAMFILYVFTHLSAYTGQMVVFATALLIFSIVVIKKQVPALAELMSSR